MATVTRTALKWDYAPAPESRDAAALKPSYDLFIGGERADNVYIALQCARDGRRSRNFNEWCRRGRGSR